MRRTARRSTRLDPGLHARLPCPAIAMCCLWHPHCDISADSSLHHLKAHRQRLPGHLMSYPRLRSYLLAAPTAASKGSNLQADRAV